MSAPLPIDPPPVLPTKPRRPRRALVETPAQATLRRLQASARGHLALAQELGHVLNPEADRDA